MAEAAEAEEEEVSLCVIMTNTEIKFHIYFSLYIKFISF